MRCGKSEGRPLVENERRRTTGSVARSGDSVASLTKRGTTMARMLVIYKTPKDPAAFDKHNFEVHVPLAKKLRVCGNTR